MKYLLAALAIALAPQAASAIDAPAPSEGWQTQNMKIRYLGSGVKRDMRGVINPVESIHSGNPTTSGNVVFTCLAGSLTVSFASEPVDFQAILTQKKVAKGRVKPKRLDFKIAGEDQQFVDWVYIPKLGIYRARKKLTAAKLYNAAVRGDSVEVKTRGKTYQSLNFPPVDTAFKNFGTDCGLGIHAKKSS